MSQTLFPGVCLVTGAAGTGIGASVAKSFAAAGCKRLAITDQNLRGLQDTADAILHAFSDVEVFTAAGDISSEEFVDFFVSQTSQRFGRLDYCVNCAGILGRYTRSTETSTAEFDRINSVNYRGSWLASRAQLRAMLLQDPLPSHDADRPGQRGSIVNIASQIGMVGRPNAPAYSASKAAVIALTRADAIDYSSAGIRVNCVCPGIVETPMTVHEDHIKLLQPLIDSVPMRRIGKVGEVADCVLFLASTKASFIQGHAMVVDGGYVIV